MKTDYTHQRFGMLTVLADAKNDKWKKRRVVVRCDCGVEKTVSLGNLTNGNSKSCGCQVLVAIKQTKTTHGKSGTSIYRIWRHAISRCHNPNNWNFAFYGGRGIQVCNRWRESFGAFYEDMGEMPSPSHQLDRIDNEGHYEPGNCRWATRHENASNKRNTRFISAFGKTQTIQRWSMETGITSKAIHSRLKRGLPAEDALTRPLRIMKATKRCHR